MKLNCKRCPTSLALIVVLNSLRRISKGNTTKQIGIDTISNVELQNCLQVSNISLFICHKLVYRIVTKTKTNFVIVFQYLVTAEDFQTRVLQMRNAEATANQERQMSLYCNACRKQFGNQKAHDNHLNSKKHKENLVRFETENGSLEKEVTTKSVIQQRPHPAIAAASEGKGKFALQQVNQMEDDEDDDDEYEDIEEEEIDSDELEEIAENPLKQSDCLFCSHAAEDLVDNLKHMSETHSFFIPDVEYCTDIEGLIHYLGEKVAVYFICLWCNDRGKTFYSLDAVRKHMLDKGHCNMLHEGLALAEYSDYYDYSSSYPDNVSDKFQIPMNWLYL